jgi:hypothetical protein
LLGWVEGDSVYSTQCVSHRAPVKGEAVSAAFHGDVFGWSSRGRGPGDVGFDDGVGEVSGTKWNLDDGARADGGGAAGAHHGG